ncbi:glycoside hydrolase family 16 protein [Neolewinella antarctica]|uniref:Beta-glucanase (GH16 family) n=1 Tax=Neolewinella antarctica TaxID=442734 RepID=A0ABX0XBF3_9BACT|nr:glycoside hydrolase family 16 protein [Neolewinella antarctica]NJC26249.1 beta-glucanase (GH16 family) [Neolewinella antarctica]
MRYLSGLLVFSVCFASACNVTSIPKSASGADAGAGVAGSEAKILRESLADRALHWSDEFNGTELDTTAWNYELGDGCPNLCGWGNNERQIYTRTNHRLEGGNLIITADKHGDRYTSTRITTKDKKSFRYGRIETRAKLPAGQGVWPAFWMLGDNIDEAQWPLAGEIDILEYVGRSPGEIFTTLHTKANHGNNASTKTTRFKDIEVGFHRYAAEWTPQMITFFVDDQLVFTFAPEKRSEAVWPFDQEFYLLLNVAIGGNYGGPEVDDSIFPQEFTIDYVRVYALD